MSSAETFGMCTAAYLDHDDQIVALFSPHKQEVMQVITLPLASCITKSAMSSLGSTKLNTTNFHGTLKNDTLILSLIWRLIIVVPL